MKDGSSKIAVCPPLESCALLDSRISYRNNIREMIRSTELFEQLIEPRSLSHAFELISKQGFDSCIIGPSITAANINLFLKDISRNIENTICSFVVLRDKFSKDELIGVHSTAEFPCPKEKFNLAVVQGLKNSNGGTLNFSRRTNPDTGEPIVLLDSIKDLGINIESLEKSEQDNLLSAIALVEKLNHLEPNFLMFRLDGTPSNKTKEEVREIIDSVYPSQDDNGLLEEFKINLEYFLYSWIKNSKEYGKKVANKNLRDNLLDYFSKNKSS